MANQQELDISSLNEQDLSEALQRALQIEARRISPSGAGHDLQSFILAAEEVGVKRESLIQALREKLGYPSSAVKEGERVFAKSVNGAFYVAVVKEVREGTVIVDFLNGSDHELPLADLKPFSLLPGQRVEVNWPGWGWWNVLLERYDELNGRLTAFDGWSRKEFSLTEVRLPVQKTAQQQRVSAMLWKVGLAAASAGAVIGALVARLFF